MQTSSVSSLKRAKFTQSPHQRTCSVAQAFVRSISWTNSERCLASSSQNILNAVETTFQKSLWFFVDSIVQVLPEDLKHNDADLNINFMSSDF